MPAVVGLIGFAAFLIVVYHWDNWFPKITHVQSEPVVEPHKDDPRWDVEG